MIALWNILIPTRKDSMNCTYVLVFMICKNVDRTTIPMGIDVTYIAESHSDRSLFGFFLLWFIHINIWLWQLLGTDAGYRQSIDDKNFWYFAHKNCDDVWWSLKEDTWITIHLIFSLLFGLVQRKMNSSKKLNQKK